MKTLYLLRHAKSSWDNPNFSDFQRPLNERGEKAAPLMGKTMRDSEFLPQTIISSPAERAKQTAFLVKKAADLDAEIRFDQRIYGAATSEILEIASELDDGFASALLVGHNPTFENAVRVLTGRFETMPTASLAVIDLEISDWSEIAPGSGRLREFLRPKQL
ncbi:MAG: histidine phosphatase family protein [Pyrinomonadaceae bacterium]